MRKKFVDEIKKHAIFDLKFFGKTKNICFTVNNKEVTMLIRVFKGLFIRNNFIERHFNF